MKTCDLFENDKVWALILCVVIGLIMFFGTLYTQWNPNYSIYKLYEIYKSSVFIGVLSIIVPFSFFLAITWFVLPIWRNKYSNSDKT